MTYLWNWSECKVIFDTADPSLDDLGTVVRKKRLHEPSKAEWDDAIDAIKALRDLDQEDFRLKVTDLSRELEREGLTAHRNADRLEGLSFFTHKTKAVRASEHARSAIMTRLSRWYTERHFHLIKEMLNRLVETGLSQHKVLRQQAASLLDASEWISNDLHAHESRVVELRKQRKSKTGRPPSIALDTIVTLMIEWGVDHNEASERFSEGGIHYAPDTLKVERWRRRVRVRVGQ